MNEVTVASNALPEKYASLIQADVNKDLSMKTGFASNLTFSQGQMTFGETNMGQGPFYVYILAACRVNAWYATPYRAGVVAIPDCYTMFDSDDEEVLAAPYPQSKQPQCADCMNCPKNVWGSGNKPGSKAKACSNYWRLSIIPACQFDAAGNPQAFNADGILAQDISQCKLPVTSGIHYKKYVKAQALATGRAKYMYMTAITVQSHPSNQFEVLFSQVGLPTDVAILDALVLRKTEAEGTIKAPFQEPRQEGQEAPAQAAVAPAVQRF